MVSELRGPRGNDSRIRKRFVRNLVFHKGKYQVTDFEAAVVPQSSELVASILT